MEQQKDAIEVTKVEAKQEKVVSKVQKKKVAFGEVKVKVDDTFKKKKSCLKTSKFEKQDLKGEGKTHSKGNINKGEVHVVNSSDWRCMHCNETNVIGVRECTQCKTPIGERNHHKDLMNQKELYRRYLKTKSQMKK